ncbi:MAG: PEP-CTERM sorting domain-containing protein [Verrucomicrobia bacterium]|nr:PEP-CTERM sorting domain-containing protein [Verrucomicrobiota bacterium]
MASAQNLTRSLASAAALAAGTNAYAAIQPLSLPANITPSALPTSGPLVVAWNVDGDAQAEFSFSFSQPQNAGALDWQATATGIAGANASILGYFGTGGYIFGQRLALGNAVAASGGNSFLSGVSLTLASRFAGLDYGAFQGANSTGYLGFSFANGGNTFFGYLQFTTTRSGGIQFLSAAYNDVPGGAITAGAAPIPEPGTLAALAFGLAGLGVVARRRRPAAE